MSNWTKRFTMAAAAGLMLTGGAFAGDKAHGEKGSKDLSAVSQKGAQEMLKMKATGEVDHDFLMMMKKHHQDGIAMSKTALQHSSDPKIREIAQRIIDMQQKDIAEFDALMASHQQPEGTGGSPTK